MPKSSLYRLSTGTRHAVHYADGSWWPCDADGRVQSQHPLSADECWDLVSRKMLIPERTVVADVTLYRLKEDPSGY